MDANRKILIVDDQDDLRLQVAKMLQQQPGQNETSSLIEQIRSRISKARTVVAPVARVAYEVDTVGQGKDAYEMVKESFSKHQPYALMFLDMRMPPGWDGLETAQRIRSIDKEIQIVIMTAYADYEQQEIAEKIGEPDKLLYIKKPFHSEEIRQLALALTEKWNLNRREKDRLILTNRLMRENSYLTRHRFKNIQETYRTILDVYVSFLDARQGIFVRRQADQRQLCAATSAEQGRKLLAGLDASYLTGTKVVTDDREGAAFFPVCFDGFDGFIYITGKNLVFPFEQLRPFLDILVETSREVLVNASLHQQQSEEKQLAAIGLATSRIASRVDGAMQTIEGVARQLEAAAAVATRQQFARELTAAATAVRQLTRGVQLFNGERQQPLQLAKHDLNDVITGVLHRFEAEIETQSIGVVPEVQAGLAIRCDAAALSHALENLLQNAIEAFRRSRQVQKELRLAAGYTNSCQDTVRLTIQDNAGGLAEDVADRVMEPFITSEPERHSGLGAAVARQIVERHNGTLTYVSDKGVGTTCQLVLPVSPETAGAGGGAPPG